MHLRRRWVVVTAAWATPLAWITITLFSGPSDGTVVSSPTAWVGAARWDENVTVLRVYGDTRLRTGDLIQSVDGHSLAEWTAAGSAPDRSVGERVTYGVRRPAPGLDRILEIEVTLHRYPVASAVSRNPATLLGVVGLLVAASFIYWRRPRDPGRPGRARGGLGGDGRRDGVPPGHRGDRPGGRSRGLAPARGRGRVGGREPPPPSRRR